MTTLNQIWRKGTAHYKTPLAGTPLYQKSEIKEWLQQKQIQIHIHREKIAYSDIKFLFIKELLEELK